MSEVLPPRVGRFAAFLAGRLEHNRIAVVGEGIRSAPDFGDVAVDITAPEQAEGLGPDCLPVFVDPWTRDGTLSPSGRSLLNGGPHRRLALVVEPGSGGNSSEAIAVLRRRLAGIELNAPLVGMARSDGDPSPGTLALVEGGERPLSPTVDVPDDFTVVALIVAFNEADIIAATVEDLRRQGVGAYVIDNWSTDGTYELAESLLGGGVVGLERSPADGPPEHFDLRSLLGRVEELASELDADWFIKPDVDEVRRGPWEGVPLREAIYRVDVAGYNRIDFTVINFPPVDNGFVPGSDFVGYFRRFDWGRRPGHFRQEKAWKNLGQEVNLADGAGHRAAFAGARVFPYKFLLQHYPIRSQAHGERKVFSERKPRVSPAARARGWHVHYDIPVPGDSFLANPDDLEVFDDSFFSRFFIERLSGVGIEREAVPQRRNP